MRRNKFAGLSKAATHSENNLVSSDGNKVSTKPIDSSIDADSSNGTHVDGLPVEPMSAVVVLDGATIEFGAVRVVFCSPASLHALLASNLV